MSQPSTVFQPFPYQQDCLDALAAARTSGQRKALVVMATGLGKTMVSAFEIKRLLESAPGRVLYLCHNNDILRQARKTYEAVLGRSRTYGYFHGTEKQMHDVDVLFASFQTMATWREAFRRDEFRYVIVDEIHHGHAATFRPTIEYFEPDFMVGLTATPERADGLDITELLGQPVYELGLFKALAQRHLCDVDYRIMTDEIQMAGVLDTPIGKLSIAGLNRTIFVPKRDEEIARIIQEKTAEVVNPRAMIFCASIAHAERMARLMPHAVIVHSKLKSKEKNARLDQFRSGEANTILTVDMLNEGIDVPEANVIVFLRSTSSRTIFLQQLGRGLRKALGKLKVLVLDFVANCERFEMIDQLQQGVREAFEPLAKAEPEIYGSLAALTLTLDGIAFDERTWELARITREVREHFIGKNSYTKEVLTKQLLAKAKELGRTPSAPEVDADPNMASTTAFYKVFNAKWNGVLREVGLPLNHRMDYTKAELTAQLLAKAKELGRTPYSREINDDPSMARVSTFLRVFNLPKWNDVIRTVGLTPTVRTDYTKAELTAQLLAKAKELGRTPTIAEVDADAGTASSDAFLTAFNLPKWSDVIRTVGLPPSVHVHTKAELTKQLHTKAKELGRAPYAVEVEKDPAMVAPGTFMRAFNITKWNDILKEAGLTPLRRKQKTFTKEILAAQLQAKAKELGRAPYVGEIKSDPSMASFTTFRDVFNTTWEVLIYLTNQLKFHILVTDMKYPSTLVEAVRYFSNPDVCIEHVAALRWPNGVICPTCGRVDVSYLEKQKRWQCKSRHAKRQFSVKLGTIFEDSPLGLDKWLPAVWMIINAKNGVSSYEIARALGVTQKTAWFMDHRIRAAMDYGSFDKKLDSPVEADETYIGGRTREEKGRFANKTAIVGVVEKKKHVGRIRAFATKQADATNTIPFLKQNLDEGATLHTDESKIYSRAKRTFIHESVNHSEKEYARGAVSTTTIDGFWNLFKRSYKGTYTHLSPAHLDRYVKEHTYRYNTRMLSDGQRFTEWFANCNRRLMYKSLIDKA